MRNIEVKVIDSHSHPQEIMVALARLTQRGHNIKNMDDLLNLFENSKDPRSGLVRSMAALPHGTIKRFCPITVAIVGASRRFLAQARTNQVGFNYVSASLQYSDYSGEADFVVPYDLMELDERINSNEASGRYLAKCRDAMDEYKNMVDYGIPNDTAGYVAPQGLRNILIMQGNHEAWMHFIRTRACNRNTNETQYVAMLIWEELLKTPGGEDMFAFAGPDCMYSTCREGKFCCGKPMKQYVDVTAPSIPRTIINAQWPLLK